MKTTIEKALEARLEAQHTALEAIRAIVFSTPKITMPQLRHRVALVLQKIDGK